MLTRREAERVRDDILFLEQCGDIPNADLLERLESYRRLNILQ